MPNNNPDSNAPKSSLVAAARRRTEDGLVHPNLRLDAFRNNLVRNIIVVTDENDDDASTRARVGGVCSPRVQMNSSTSFATPMTMTEAITPTGSVE
ncbi:MAG: hypothetical protein HT580_06815 [Dechloromonas sp.]|nr:MAG: hypothetical protein HT580_06815 [Dechloromonas sp.]